MGKVCTGRGTGAKGKLSAWENEAETPALPAQMSLSCPMTLMTGGQVCSESPLNVTVPRPCDTPARGHLQCHQEQLFLFKPVFFQFLFPLNALLLALSAHAPFPSPRLSCQLPATPRSRHKSQGLKVRGWEGTSPCSPPASPWHSMGGCQLRDGSL